MKNEGSGKTYSTQQVRQMGSFGTSRSGMLIPKDSNEKIFFEKRLCDRGIWDILQVCHCVLFDINMIPPYPFKVKHECNMPRVGMDGYVDTHRNKKEAKCASIK